MVVEYSGMSKFLPAGLSDFSPDKSVTQAAIEPCAKTPTKKTVYLTFDDGIQPGTKEMYELLKKNKVRATFFMTGAHAKHSEAQEKGLLKKIREDPDFEIGNHSNSHANQRYEGFYESGGLLLPSGKRRSVLDDFRACDKTLSALLELPSSHMFISARLPGRDTWRVNGVPPITSGNWLWSKLNRDSYEEAEELKNAGYQVYGWDSEWEMDFKGTNQHSDFDPDVDYTAEQLAGLKAPENFPVYDPNYKTT